MNFKVHQCVNEMNSRQNIANLICCWVWHNTWENFLKHIICIEHSSRWREKERAKKKKKEFKQRNCNVGAKIEGIYLLSIQ